MNYPNLVASVWIGIRTNSSRELFVRIIRVSVKRALNITLCLLLWRNLCSSFFLRIGTNSNSEKYRYRTNTIIFYSIIYSLIDWLIDWFIHSFKTPSLASLSDVLATFNMTWFDDLVLSLLFTNYLVGYKTEHSQNHSSGFRRFYCNFFPFRFLFNTTK